MSPEIPSGVKKIIRPPIKAISCGIVWILILFNLYLRKRDKDCIPAFFVNLCMNDSLVFKINPEKIRYHIEDPDIMHDNLFVWSGDWDKVMTDIWQHEKFDLIKELIVDKKEYRDIRFFSYAMEELRAGSPLSRGNILLDSEDKLMEYFRKQEKLFERIKNEGFDLDKAPECGITITRQGQFVHYRQGHHTLAMAKILGFDVVLVRIRAIHRQWLLDRIKTGRLNFLRSLAIAFEEIKNP
jgi:hypothetical protein